MRNFLGTEATEDTETTENDLRFHSFKNSIRVFRGLRGFRADKEISLISATKKMRANCLNCDNPLSSDDRFCPNCGQKTDTHRLSFHDLLHDTIHFFTHADKGIFHLLKELAIRPGLVARGYVEGARKKYFNPLNFLLIVAGIVVFMTTIFPGNSNGNPNRRTQNTEARPQTKPTPEQMKHYAEMGARGQKVTRFYSKSTNYLPIIATPLVALLFWLFYRNNKLNYTEHLIANMYFIGFTILLYALVFVPLMSKYGYALYAYFAFEITYRSLAYYQFIGKKGVWQVLKAFLISILFLAIWSAAMWYLTKLYVETGFGIF